MSCRPIDVMAKLTVRVPRGHQGYWEIIRSLGTDGGRFTLDDVDQMTNAHRASVRDYLRRLTRAGIVASDGDQNNGVRTYALVANPGPEAPRLRRDGSPAKAPLGQENMWRTMKMAGASGFTARDLAISAATEEHPVKFETAKAYIKALHKAGYLVMVSGGNCREPGIYRLLPSMISGPLAPMIQRVKAVWDPNLCRHVGPAEVEEVSP